jgi:hypothetical protein
MAYKSNKQARVEYLLNEAKNRATNRRNHERRKAKRSSTTFGKAILVLFLLFFLVQFLSHRSHSTQRAIQSTTVSEPLR